VTAFALLGSGEFEPWAEPVDRWLLDRAAEAGRDGSVLILPTASAPEGDAVFDKWGTMGLEHYAALQAPAEVVPLKTREDAASEELAAGLATASVVFFSGVLEKKDKAFALQVLKNPALAVWVFRREAPRVAEAL